jgi:hypothetical protein
MHWQVVEKCTALSLEERQHLLSPTTWTKPPSDPNHSPSDASTPFPPLMPGCAPSSVHRPVRLPSENSSLFSRTSFEYDSPPVLPESATSRDSVISRLSPEVKDDTRLVYSPQSASRDEKAQAVHGDNGDKPNGTFVVRDWGNSFLGIYYSSETLSVMR